MFMFNVFNKNADFILIYAAQRQHDNIHNSCFACHPITSCESYLLGVVMYYGISDSEVGMLYIIYFALKIYTLHVHLHTLQENEKDIRQFVAILYIRYLWVVNSDFIFRSTSYKLPNVSFFVSRQAAV